MSADWRSRYRLNKRRESFSTGEKNVDSTQTKRRAIVLTHQLRWGEKWQKTKPHLRASLARRPKS
ncbi:hypothetical protein BQ8794_70229 [Mesorhizobium prunaredense]|uniref:Uncharacterized protein n=1 Tax=Mesorhizobium prunaredense TaxID=1631249 RepID=A0A1R3VK81_9HYPH|nr:hypothetical protein BQ8794_70229 [Mesorhizobium prunaredense]